MSSSKLVYSTSGNNTCPRCGKALFKCRCDTQSAPASTGDGIVRIQRETKGRGGKEVTVITGLPLADAELKTLAKKLKSAAGSGGSIKNGAIEIQGDKRAVCQTVLQQAGYTVKLAGG
jgi:translation initiation factor 1